MCIRRPIASIFKSISTCTKQKREAQWTGAAGERERERKRRARIEWVGSRNRPCSHVCTCTTCTCAALSLSRVFSHSLLFFGEVPRRLILAVEDPVPLVAVLAFFPDVPDTKLAFAPDAAHAVLFSGVRVRQAPLFERIARLDVRMGGLTWPRYLSFHSDRLNLVWSFSVIVDVFWRGE